MLKNRLKPLLIGSVLTLTGLTSTYALAPYIRQAVNPAALHLETELELELKEPAEAVDENEPADEAASADAAAITNEAEPATTQTTTPAAPPAQASPPSTGKAEQPPAAVAPATPPPVASQPPTTSTGTGHSSPPSRADGGTTSRALLQADLNSFVLDKIKTYQGRYPYLLNNDYANYNGVTTNIVYQNSLLLKAHPSGNRANHCVGITFEVFFKAMQERNRQLGLSADDFNGMTANQMRDFILTWYVANGPKSSNNLAVAIERYGLGQRITNWAAARPGDFVDFSRSNHTGHAVVLINWLYRDGQIIGLRYWSSQESTGGIGYREEYFNILNERGVPYGNILRDHVYIGRVGSVQNYRPLR